jgi:hypothetical protein
MGKFSELLKADKPKNIDQDKPDKSSDTGHNSDLAKSFHKSSSINRSANRSTHQSIRRSTGKVMERPRGFYITERLNDRLDEAVRYFQDIHGIKKADRSVVITAMLDREENWSDEALDSLVDRLMSELTSRLTS